MIIEIIGTCVGVIGGLFVIDAVSTIYDHTGEIGKLRVENEFLKKQYHELKHYITNIDTKLLTIQTNIAILQKKVKDLE